MKKVERINTIMRYINNRSQQIEHAVPRAARKRVAVQIRVGIGDGDIF